MADLLIALCLNASFWGGIAQFVGARAHRDGVGRVLMTAIAGVALIVVSLEMLGAFGLINRLTVGTVCLVAGTAGLVRRSRMPRVAPELSAVRAGAPGGAGTARPTVPSMSAQTSAAPWTRAWSLLAVGLALWAALVYFLIGLLFPVEPISDAPIYHLFLAARWFQSGTLELVPTPFGEEAATYFPANGDLWFTWLLATGAGPFVKVGQWPFLVVGATALFGVARGTGAPWPAAILPAALWTCLPLVLTQSSLANVDLIWTAFYLGAVHFLLQAMSEADDGVAIARPGEPPASARVGGPGALAWFAWSCGLVIGTKTVGAILVVPLLVPALAALVRRRAGLRELPWLTAGLLVPAAYWYGRNLWLTGNPVYPLQVSLFGRVWAEGWFGRSAMEATAYHVPVGAWWVLLDRLSVTAGAIGLMLAVVGIASGWRLGVSPSVDRVSRRALAICATLAVAHVVIYWCVIPYNTQERFLSAALGLAVIPLAAIASRQTGAQAVLCALLAWQLVAGWHGGVFTPRRLVETPIAWGQAQARFYPRGGFADRLWPGWEILERAVRPDGARIAYAGTNLPYYLLGIGLRNRVEYVNINRETDWRPHDYHRARRRVPGFELARDPWPQWYRADANVEAWISNLRQRRIEFLFVARENRHGRLDPGPGGLPRFPIEKAWADAHPERFVDLGPYQYDPGTIPWVRVYRVVPAP